MSLLLPLDVKWPYAKDQHGFPVFGAAAISEDELKSVVVAVNNHERLVDQLAEVKEFMEVELTGTAWADCRHMAHSIGKLLSDLEDVK